MKYRNLKVLTLALLVGTVGLFAACGDDPVANSGNGTDNQNNQTNNGEEGPWQVDIDEAASTLDVEEGETVEVVAEVFGEDQMMDSQNILFSVGDYTAEDSWVVGNDPVEFTFDWETEEGDAGSHTAEVAMEDEDASDTTDVTVEEVGGDNGNGNGNGGDDNGDADAEFEVEIDEGESTLEVDEGEDLEVFTVMTNVGSEAGVPDISAELDGQPLQLEPEGEMQDIEPNQAVQMPIQLPTGEQGIPQGEDQTFTVITSIDEASTQVTVN